MKTQPYNQVQNAKPGELMLLARLLHIIGGSSAKVGERIEVVVYIDFQIEKLLG
jgi:hypothetical protein